MKKPAWLVLTVICVAAGLVLAFTHTLTERVVEERSRAAADQARAALLPGADSFEELPVPEGTEVGGVSILACHEGLRGGEGFGKVVIVSVKGYRGPIEVTVGVTKDGGIAGIACGGEGFSETAGLGELVRGEAFTGQFTGASAPVAVGQDGGGIDAITNATISSRAVCDAVNAACDYAASVSR